MTAGARQGLDRAELREIAIKIVARRAAPAGYSLRASLCDCHGIKPIGAVAPVSSSLACHLQPKRRHPDLAGFHEIKHDGFRIIARRDARGVRLVTRNGNDFSARFPNVAAAVNALPVRSCLIDGEAIVTDDRGLAVFGMIRNRRHELRVIGRRARLIVRTPLIELTRSTMRPLASTFAAAKNGGRAGC